MEKKENFYDTTRFFVAVMVGLFLISYLFWGVLFQGPQRRHPGSLERGLYRNAPAMTESSSRSQRGMFPGGVGGNRQNFSRDNTPSRQ